MLRPRRLALAGIGAFLLVVVSVGALAVVMLRSWSNDKDFGAYLPQTWSSATYIRFGKVLEHLENVPAFKSQLNSPGVRFETMGADIHDVDELVRVQNGNITYSLVKFKRPMEPQTLFRGFVSNEAHQGIQIYTVEAASPGGISYVALANPQLAIQVSDLGAIKGSLDQAVAGRTGSLGLPSGHDVVSRIQGLGSEHGDSTQTAGLSMLGVTGWTITADMGPTIRCEAIIGFTNNQSAAGFHMIVDLGRQKAREQAKRTGQPIDSSLEQIGCRLTGSQVRLSRSAPIDDLARATTPAIGSATEGVQFMSPFGGAPGTQGSFLGTSPLSGAAGTPAQRQAAP